MTTIQIKYSSKIIQQETSTTVLVPETINTQTRVLWLLHGWSGDHMDWLTHSNLTQLVAGINLVVVMPSGYNSYYSNAKFGPDYYDFYVDELFPYLQQLFNLPLTKRNNFIAGLSMGGYGAFKIALRQHEKYEGAASLSGVLDICSAYQSNWERKEDFKRIFGSQMDFKGSDDDLVSLVQNDDFNDLKFLMYAGEDDPLLPESQHFYEVARAFMPIEFHILPGAHTWDFWGRHLSDIINWIYMQKEESIR